MLWHMYKLFISMQDYPLRAGFGMGIIVALVILVLATIGLVAAA